MRLIDSQEVVNWATDAIVFGSDSKCLRILAGLCPPFDRDEIKRLLGAALKELQIDELPEQLQVPVYVTSILKAMLDKELPRNEALRRISDLYLQRNYDGHLKDFYHLYYAKWDLESYNEQYYWAGANRSNIDRLIDDYSKKWLKNHATE